MTTASITTTASVPADYHQQNNEDYCGPACAQTLLNFFGLNLQAAGNGQFDLINGIIRSAALVEPGMTSGPKGLAKALNCKNPRFNDFSFVCASSRGAQAFSEYVAEQIEKYEAPAVALVYAKFHWIVIVGVKRDQQHAVDGFMVHNPWPPIGGAYYTQEGFPNHDPLAFPHKCGDGRVRAAGQGPVAHPAYVDRGAMGNHISYSGWVCEYWEHPYPAEGTRWDDRFVAICPADPTGTQEQCKDGQDKTRFDDRGDPSGEPCDQQGTPITSDLEAVTAALQGMWAHGLAAEGLWAGALAGQTVANPRYDQVSEVNYIYKPGSYYLVWFTTSAGQASVCARVDRQTGRYVESVAVPEGAGRAITPIDLHGHLFQDMVQLQNRQGGTPQGADGNNGADHLIEIEGRVFDLSKRFKDPDVVWLPSNHSFSPFYPFYRVVVPDEQGNPITLYIRTYDEKGFLKLPLVPNEEPVIPDQPNL